MISTSRKPGEVRNDSPIAGDFERLGAVCEFVGKGFGDRLLLSVDVWMKVSLSSCGGYGYAHILNKVVPHLHDVGVDRGAIEVAAINNPRRLLSPNGQ